MAARWQGLPMIRTVALAALALPLAACSSEPAADPAPAEVAPQEAFWQALSSHCGKAYAGRMTSDEDADAEMRGAEMAMHVRATARTGATEADIREVLLHVAIYAGVPTANQAIKVAKQALAEVASGRED